MFMSDDQDGPNNKGVAFALWLACVFGLCGIHRFYLGRTGTGLLWLFTFGLFGFGQLVDLIRLPAMVEEENTKNAALQALAEKRALQGIGVPLLAPPRGPAPVVAAEESVTPESFRIKLVQAAAKYGGKLTVTQGVLATGKTFAEVEEELDAMTRSGYVGIDNDESSGVVVYTFGQLELS